MTDLASAVVTRALTELVPGQSSRIMALNVEAALRARLMALGFQPGQSVELIRRAPFAGPLHVRLGTTDVIIRRADAQAVQIA